MIRISRKDDIRQVFERCREQALQLWYFPIFYLFVFHLIEFSERKSLPGLNQIEMPVKYGFGVSPM